MCNSVVQRKHLSSSSLFPAMTVLKYEGSKPEKRQVWSELLPWAFSYTHYSLAFKVPSRYSTYPTVSFYGQDTELNQAYTIYITRVQ